MPKVFVPKVVRVNPKRPPAIYKNLYLYYR